MRIFLTIYFLLLAGSSWAKDGGSDTVKRRDIAAIRVYKAPKIDGKIDEDVWQNAPIASDFIQNEPNPGKKASQRTEVRVLYDNYAVYIAATMYDVSKDSIIRQYSQRDNEDNTDIFAVFIGPYNDKQSGYGFVVHPTGVQWDARYSQEQGQDVAWNAVWESRVYIDETNWYVEIKFPYSAIRFPEKEKQDWGINFARKIRRLREFSFWNEVNPAVSGFANQWGNLKGVENIEAPARLAFSPYVSAYLEHYPSDVSGSSNFSKSFNGGLDLKYGLNDAFTLDVTLVPDFGQVQSDNQVLNLSPFEVRFNENRPFFMEGTELFNKGGLFYSRRLGGTPLNRDEPYDQLNENEEVTSNPAASQLINSFKVSGRNKNGLGIGIFNGLTKNMYATITDTITGEKRQVLTDPITNYNVLVLDQNLRNNSYITLINTNVTRNGSHYDANVTGGMFKFNNKTNMYAFEGGGTLSQKHFEDSTAFGHATNISFNREGGNFNYGFEYFEESDTYDPNDLGFLYNNNSRSANVYVGYNVYTPFWRFQSTWSSLDVGYERLYKPDAFSNFYFDASLGGTFKNWITAGLFYIVEPVETYDFFEPRVWGRYYTWQPSQNVGGFMSTDYRKKLAFDFRTNYRRFKTEGRYRLNFRIGPRVRFNDKFSMSYSLERSHFEKDEGAAIDLDGDGTIIGADIIFGKRRQITYENILNASYIFTNRMGLTLRARHYWSTVAYNSFHILDKKGHLTPSGYTGLDTDGESLHNTNFNAFNIDMVYRWVFAPGSEMSIVYKSALLTFNNDVSKSYSANFQDVLDSPQTKSLSIKVLYYLDYLMIKKKSNSTP